MLRKVQVIDPISLREDKSLEIRICDRIYDGDQLLHEDRETKILSPGDSVVEYGDDVVSAAKAFWTPELVAARLAEKEAAEREAAERIAKEAAEHEALQLLEREVTEQAELRAAAEREAVEHDRQRIEDLERQVGELQEQIRVLTGGPASTDLPAS